MPGVAPKTLLEPQFVQARRRHGFDAADGVQIVEVAARQPAPVDLQRTDVEGSANEADNLRQVRPDADLSQPLDDGAPPHPTGRIAQHLIGFGKSEADAVSIHQRSEAADVAEQGFARRRIGRRLGQGGATFRPWRRPACGDRRAGLRPILRKGCG